MSIDTQSFPVHQSVPAGFTLVNDLQEAEFRATGSINGAAKVAQVDWNGEVRIAARFRPPHRLDDIKSSLGVRGMVDADQYRTEYEKGWRFARRSDGYPGGSWAMEDGFLDAAAGRTKWHLAYCTNHDECGEG